MNLRGLTASVVTAVNLKTPLILQRNVGWYTDPSGKRTAKFAPAFGLWGQVQALTFRDLVQTEGLNLQGTRRAIYLENNYDGAVRVSEKGGDIIAMPDGTVWLVALVLETWKHWCKVAVTLQNQVALVDDAGKVVTDNSGNIVYQDTPLKIPLVDDQGNPVVDDNGNIVYQ